jgi:glycosyltransferase involved in cell wall biosynthesis
VTERLKITFVIETLSAGGAERVLANMANYWSRRGHSIEIFTFWSKGSLPFYTLDTAVVHFPLSVAGGSSNLARFIINNWRRIETIREAIRKSQPDIIISFMDRPNMLTSLACVGCGIPLVLSERVDPAECSIGGMGWEILRRLTYPLADSVVAQTKPALSYFGPIIRRRGSVIPNGIAVPPEAAALRPGCESGRKIVAVGRLARQKGFDLLLAAFFKVHERFPEWSLTIWGEGPERPTLERQRKELGLEGCVHLPGRTQNIFQEMRKSDLFVLSSRFEGFPNALLEAMACNLPVISFDCRSGPSEIIQHNVDGILTPPEDVNRLADAMNRLISDASMRDQLGKRAGEVTQRFNTEKIMGEWERLLTTLVSARGARKKMSKVSIEQGSSARA